ETVAGISLTGGQSTITTTPGGGGPVTLTAGTLARSAGAAVAFAGAGLGGAGNSVVFTTPPTLTGGVLPYATAGTDFAPYGAGGVAAFAGYVPMPAGGTGAENVRLTG